MGRGRQRVDVKGATSMSLYYCNRDKRVLSPKQVADHKCLMKNAKRKRFIARDGKHHFRMVGEKCWRLIVERKGVRKV